MTIDESNVAILSTVINFELYAKSSKLYPKNIQKYVIDGRNGMYGLHSIFYMMKKLKGRGIEWLVMADEDVLFQDSEVVFEIINKMKAENYTVCGVRDGGVISHRFFNPYFINTFFSIINFKEIESIWNEKEIKRSNDISEYVFDDDLTGLRGQYDLKSFYEPYYCFYLWLRKKNKRFLFLEAQVTEDQITNSVLYEEKEFLHHTWFARSYGKNEKHTARIDKIFKSLQFIDNKVSDFILLKSKTFFWTQKIKKNYRKVMKKLEKVFQKQ